MKIVGLSADAVDEQMYTDKEGKRKMQIGKGATAGKKGEDAAAVQPKAVVKKSNSTSASTTGGSGSGKTGGDGTGTKKAGSGTGGSKTTTRVLQNATQTPAGNATATNTDWKKLPKEEDYMRVEVGKEMFEVGGPLHGKKRPIIMFNKHSNDYVSEFPRGRKGDYDATTGKKINKTTAAKTAAIANAATVDEDDY